MRKRAADGLGLTRQFGVVGCHQAAAEAAAAARAERAAASEAAAAAVRAEEAWRRNMLRMRSEVDARMKALTLLKEQREEEEEDRSQMFRTAGMRCGDHTLGFPGAVRVSFPRAPWAVTVRLPAGRLPKIVTVLPIVLLYHNETLSFAQRYFVEQVTHVLRAAGLKVAPRPPPVCTPSKGQHVQQCQARGCLMPRRLMLRRSLLSLSQFICTRERIRLFPYHRHCDAACGADRRKTLKH